MTLLTLARFLTYAGLALLLGGAVMRRWRLADLPAGWLALGAGALLLGAGLEVGSTLIELGFTAPGDVEGYLASTRPGRAAVLRLIGAALLLAAELQGKESGRVWRGLALLGGVLALWGVSSAGHAAERGTFWTLLDALHAAAAAIWVGGVLALTRSRPTPQTTRRFSRLALGCLAALTLSGVAAVLMRVPLPLLWAALCGSTWGVALLLKLGLIALALLSALWVRRVLYTRAGPTRSHPLWLESALLLAVLGASGALATTPPPTTAQLQRQVVPVRLTLAGQAISGELSLSGPGDLRLRLRPAVPGLRARLIMTDHPMPAQPLSVQASGDELRAQTRLWMSGHWVLEVKVGDQTARVAFSD